MYYVPRLPITQSVTLPTLFGGFRLLRHILIRERITLLHAHQASIGGGGGGGGALAAAST